MEETTQFGTPNHQCNRENNYFSGLQIVDLNLYNIALNKVVMKQLYIRYYSRFDYNNITFYNKNNTSHIYKNGLIFKDNSRTLMNQNPFLNKLYFNIKGHDIDGKYAIFVANYHSKQILQIYFVDY